MLILILQYNTNRIKNITYNVRDYLHRESRILVIRYTALNNSLQTPAKNTR